MTHAQRLLQRITPGSSIRRMDATRFLGPDWKRDAQLARINMKNAFANFVLLFPDKFKLENNSVRSLEQDPRVGSSGQTLQRLRRVVEPPKERPRGLIDQFLRVS